MTQEELAALTDEALLQEAKKMKSSNVFDALFIGLLAGIAVYSTVRNGWGLLTFLPLAYAPIAVKNKAKHKALEKLLKERNLK